MKKKIYFFSVIIPIKEPNRNLFQNIKSINLSQKNLNFNIEIIVVTNNFYSKGKNYLNTRFLKSGRVGPGIKRDIAAKIAKGKYLVFFDDDSYPSNNYFKILNKQIIKSKQLVFAGPGLSPKNSNFFQKLSNIFFENKLMGGVAERYKSIGNIRLVDDWPTVNFIIEKKLFTKIKGFEIDFWPGEDTYLCNKLKKFNIRIQYLPKLIVYHYRRLDLFSYMYQIKNYAYTRGFFFKKFKGNSVKIKYTMPSLLLLNVLFFSTSILVSNIFLIYVFGLPIIIYLIYLITVSILQVKQGYRIFFGLICLVPTTHIIYGFNFLKGLITSKYKLKLR